jgi:hypothetical protein
LAEAVQHQAVIQLKLSNFCEFQALSIPRICLYNPDSFAVVGKLLYSTSVIGKRNWLLSIHYAIFSVTIPLQVLITSILNVTKSLLGTKKSNWLRSGTVTPLHLSLYRIKVKALKSSFFYQ